MYTILLNHTKSDWNHHKELERNPQEHLKKKDLPITQFSLLLFQVLPVLHVSLDTRDMADVPQFRADRQFNV